jgi:hypothetical protein
VSAFLTFTGRDGEPGIWWLDDGTMYVPRGMSGREAMQDLGVWFELVEPKTVAAWRKVAA